MLDKLIDLLISFLHLFRFHEVVDCYQRGIVLRFGRFQREAGPGLRWHWPFGIERISVDNVVPRTIRLDPQSVTTRDNVQAVVSAVITYQVEDIKTFILEVESARHAMEDVGYGSVARYMMAHTFDEARGLDTPEDRRKALDVENELTKTARRRAARYGVRVIDVQLVDFTRSRSIRLMQAGTHQTQHH